MATQFTLPRQVKIQPSGIPYAHAVAKFYAAGTLTAQTVYQDFAMTTPHAASGVEADDDGYFAVIWLNPDAAADYRVMIRSSGGVLLEDIDNIPRNPLSTSQIAQALYPRTTAEQSVSVTPSSYLYPTYQSPRYGSVGNDSTNDATALQNMLLSAAAESNLTNCAVAELKGASAKFRVDAGLTFDPQKVIFEGHGNTLNFANKTSGAFSGLKLSATDENLSRTFLRHAVRGVRNVVLEGPSYTVNADSVGIELVDEADDGLGNYRAGGIHLDSIAVIGFAYALKFGAGAWGSTVVNFTAGHDTGNLGGVGVYAPSPWTDGQECPKFLGGHISNRTAAFQFGVGSVKVIGMSIDGCPTIGNLGGNGHMTFANGYSEFTDGDNGSFKFRCEDSNAVVELLGWEFNVRPDVLATRTKALINTDGGVNGDGTVILRNCLFKGTNSEWYLANGGYLVAGDGLVYASGLVYKGFPWGPLPHKKLQWLAYPDMDNAQCLAAFALSNSGAFNPARTTSVSDGVSTRDVVRFQINNGAGSGSYSRAVFVRPVSPGKACTVCMDACGSLTGTNVVFEMSVIYRDAIGNSLFSQTTTIASASATLYTTYGADVGVFLPGTVLVEIQLQLRATSTAGGNAVWNVSPLGIGYPSGDGDAAPTTLSALATYDPASLGDGVGATTTVTCTGAAVGDFAQVSFSNDLLGITLTAWVSAADTVSVRFQNESGGTLDLASGTLRVKVTKV